MVYANLIQAVDKNNLTVNTYTFIINIKDRVNSVTVWISRLCHILPSLYTTSK